MHHHAQRLLIAFFAIGQCFVNLDDASAEDFIWVEGESAASSDMKGHGWYDSVKETELSGGRWLSHFRSGVQPVATYRVRAEEACAHEFWVRANPIQAAMSYRLNGGSWTAVSFEKREQHLNIASDGKPDMRFVAWMKASPVELKSGRNTIEFRFESKNNNHGGLDCFVLSREPFFPQGALKPGEKTGLADPGMWAFEPDRDRFSSESLLDLSDLNEKPAGKSGWVARSSGGDDFVDGAGQPLRFWAVNTNVHRRDDMAAVEEHARWLAKRGVNMVRHHGHVNPLPGGKLTDVNQKDIDAAWRLVAAMKTQGIYVTVSPYWAVSVDVQPNWGLKDPGGKNLTGLLFFDKQLQEAYKAWVRSLMSRPNPHTGIPLAEDPAVAIFQIQNEDSLLFWTESAIQGEQRVALGKLFGTWLVDKYGSLENAGRTWGGRTDVKGDDPRAGIVMPREIYHLTQEQRGPMAKRLNDQLAFYTETMRDFNLEIARFLREEIGYRGLINAGNWRTADQAKLLDAERYAYAANDVIGVNRYFNGGRHENPTEKRKAGYLVSEGDLFDGKSVLTQPWAFPLALRQVSGHPMIISESAWVPPLKYQTEGPLLVAAYSGLTGFDIFYWFSTGDVGFGPPMDKWQLSTPAQIGMFPAAALMHRKGYITKGEPVVVEHRTPQEISSREPPLLPEEAGFDPNRDTRAPASSAEAARAGKVTPLAYLAGPVEVAFDRGRDEVADLSRLVTPNSKTVTSITGEHAWNYEAGYCTVNAAKAQGATGDLSQATPIELTNVTIRSTNDYATVFAVSMDDQPLASSRRVLIQVGTIARPYGWKTSPAADGMDRIDSLGGSPWNIAESDITIEIANSRLSKLTQLDANGVPIGEVDIERRGGRFVVKLPGNAMYLIAE